ncbi:hypothetical protein [Pseudomonas capsici]|uniref:hypothetical protein n=1 Tax=Pseudomonas capsici TaxID=2810614 RepID=UPI0021F20A88|nr:hypothetical protein [Pseudomonas capsici]MCV4285903.1 hypothetical protein [Pseudomonas capsici]
MDKINEGLSIITNGHYTLARDEKGMANAETLVIGRRPPSVMNVVCMPENLVKIRSIVDREGGLLLPKWSDVHVVNAERGNYFKALEAANIAHRVPGTPGRRVKAVSAVPGIDIDYRPGLWLHADLILPLARWMGSRQSSPHKTPLVAFLERHLIPAEPTAPVALQEVASSFADEVSTAELKVLRKIDQVLMGDGVSAAERREVLSSRITVMQGA